MLANTPFCIGYESPDLLEIAQHWALKYGFVIEQNAIPRLHVEFDQLALLMPGFLPLSVELNPTKTRQEAALQGLIRACKPKKGMRIIDVTAGWGRDAALLASFGANVCMIERQPVMAALLEDGLARHAQPTDGELSLVYQDAISYLNTCLPQDYPDVIYIDPMHPLRQKSALVKKDMQALQTLFGPDVDALQLIRTACVRVKQKVVVKWPQRLAPLIPPSWSLAGKTVRFDVYVI